MIGVRQAGDGDAEILAELNRYVHEVHLDRIPRRFKPAEPAAVAEWFRAMVRKPAVRAWIAESEGAAAGYALTTLHERPETPFTYRLAILQIDQLGVAPGFRRQGVGRVLIERVLEDARQRGIQDVEGNSWFFNTGAHDLLYSTGFHSQIIRFNRPAS